MSCCRIARIPSKKKLPERRTATSDTFVGGNTGSGKSRFIWFIFPSLPRDISLLTHSARRLIGATDTQRIRFQNSGRAHHARCVQWSTEATALPAQSSCSAFLQGNEILSLLISSPLRVRSKHLPPGFFPVFSFCLMLKQTW